METHKAEGVAELQLEEGGNLLRGRLLRMDREKVTLRLSNDGMGLHEGRVGETAHLILIVGGAAYTASTRILAAAGGVLVVGYDSIRKMERRGAYRLPCRIPVIFRFARAGYGARGRLQGHAINLSMGGMCLLTQAMVRLEDDLAVTFTVPGSIGTVSADARVMHCAFREDGQRVAGLGFTRLAPMEQIRLIRFIEQAKALANARSGSSA